MSRFAHSCLASRCICSLPSGCNLVCHRSLFQRAYSCLVHSIALLTARASLFDLVAGPTSRNILEIVPNEVVIERATSPLEHSLRVLIRSSLTAAIGVTLVLYPRISGLDKHVRPEIILRTAAFASETHLTITFE